MLRSSFLGFFFKGKKWRLSRSVKTSGKSSYQCWKALFSGKFVVDELRLDRPRFQFEVDPTGYANWRFGEGALNRLRPKTPAVIPRQLWVTDAQLQYVNARSNTIKRVDVQNLFRHVYAKEKRLVFSLVTIATKMANFTIFSIFEQFCRISFS